MVPFYQCHATQCLPSVSGMQCIYVTQISSPRPVSEMRAPLGTMMVMTLVLLTWAHTALATGKQL